MDREYPFTILDLLPLMNLKLREPYNQNAEFVYANCPFCGDKKHRLKIFRDGGWQCFHCGESGRMLALYARTVLDRPCMTHADMLEVSADAMRRLRLPPDAKPTAPVVRQKVEKVRREDNAPAADKNRTYNALLSIAELDLTDDHYDELARRGLSEGLIEMNQYRSFGKDLTWAKTPEILQIYGKEVAPLLQDHPKLRTMNRVEFCAGLLLAQTLIGLECRMEGVPGFFKVGNHWCFRVVQDSILLPLRNELGMIIGLQYRLQSNPYMRYMTLSSFGFDQGVSPQELHHVPLMSAELGDQPALVITEGPLKADVLTALAGKPISVLCITGVNVIRDLPDIFAQSHRAGVQRVVNALDMDRYLNSNVRKAVSRIRKLAQNAGLQFSSLCWDKPRAEALCAEFADIAAENAVKLPDVMPDDPFRRLNLLASILDRNKIEHTKNWDANDAPYKQKGIDDALFAALRRP